MYGMLSSVEDVMRALTTHVLWFAPRHFLYAADTLTKLK